MKRSRILLMIAILAIALVTALIVGGGNGKSAAKSPSQEAAGHEGHDHDAAGNEEHGEEGAAGHEEHGEEEHEKPVIAGLKLEPAAAGESWDVIAATGKVGPNTNQVVKVGPRIAGKITKVYASVGDVVSRGQVLATISSVELAQARAQYRQTSARVKAAEQAYNQQVKLAKLGAFAGRPIEEARSEHASAQGELAQAKSEVAQSKSELARAEGELAQCAARLTRAKDLYKDEIVSKQDLESAEAEYKRDSAEVEAAKSKIRQAEAKVQQMEARIGISKSYLDREKKIYGSNLLSTREIQQAKAALTEAKIELGSAADTIRVLGASPGGSGETIAIASPISGRVTERNTNLGEMAEPSGTLFTVMNLADVWVEANVYEKDIARVRKGQMVEIKVNGYSDKVFSGNVTLVSDVLDPASRTAKIRCVVSNSGGMLKPEMFATINIITAKRGQAVLVKKEAVLDEAGKKIVFIACADCPEDEKAGKSVCGEYDKREVTLGSMHADRVEVLQGLESGEEVVVKGQYQLKTALGSGKLEAGCGDH